jgi:DNA-directed RNA polymerase subunit omega
MARVTNSDTLPYVDSRYELGMLASQRVRDLAGNAQPVVEKGNDKLTVVALREIASGKLDIEQVRHEFVESYKEHKQNNEDVESTSEVPTTNQQAQAEIDGLFEGAQPETAEEMEEEADDTPDSDEE